MEFRVFQPTYVNRAGATITSDTWHVAFRDHLDRRQRVIGGTREKDATRVAERVRDLVQCRRLAEAPDEKLHRWIDSQSPKLREKLIGMDLVDARSLAASLTVTVLLEGQKDAAGAVTTPGYRQQLAARGGTEEHVRPTCQRVAAIIEACGFTFFSDLVAPGAENRVLLWLGAQRAKGTIGGTTFNYYVRDFRSFCRWLAKALKSSTVPMVDLARVKNAQADAKTRRPLTTSEMPLLLKAAAAGGMIQGLTGDERAILYRFAFETGLRPSQIRALVVSDFALDASPPTVHTVAKHVKRRRPHTQVLRPSLATELAERFRTKLPGAAAFKMPGESHMADMIRRDLAAARAAWIDQAGADDDERERRQRSDFLAKVNHKKETAVFYSTRHGHGQALAEGGVPEKDIAASMHHASRATTARYLHTDRASVKAAIEAMPDMPFPAPQKATGTDGAMDFPPATVAPRLRTACAARNTSMESGGVSGGSVVKSEPSISTPKTHKMGFSGENQETGLLAELADAMDSKSISRKGVSVQLR